MSQKRVWFRFLLKNGSSGRVVAQVLVADLVAEGVLVAGIFTEEVIQVVAEEILVAGVIIEGPVVKVIAEKRINCCRRGFEHGSRRRRGSGCGGC